MPDSATGTTAAPLRCEVADGIACVTLAAPKTLNALSTAMLGAVSATCDRLARNDQIRVVLLRAEGKAFSAGHDLNEMQGFRRDHDAGATRLQALFDLCASVMQQIVALPQPVIAAVQGVATAAGCQLACSCDLIVASTTARFGVNGISIGLFCATPAVALSRRLAPGAAFELLTTGEFLSAERAHALGLVNRLAAPDDLDTEALALAQGIAAKDPAAIRLGKQAFQAQLGLPLDRAYATAGRTMVENALRPDTAAAMQAFIDRRR